MGTKRGSLDWEWELPSGAHVKASLDKGVESVWLSKRLVSRAPVGTKVTGHIIPLPSGGPYRGEEAAVRFDADGLGCTFTIGDNAQPPTRFPGDRPVVRNTAQWAWLAFGLAALLFVSGAAVGVSRYVAARRALMEINPDAPLSLSLASPDGLFVTHFPTGFTAEIEKGATESYSAVMVTRAASDVFAGFLSFRHPTSTSVDELERVIGKGVDVEWAGKGIKFRETGRSRTLCFGEQGVAVEGRASKGMSEARSWACTFIRNGHGYYFFYMLPANGSAASEAMLRRIVDGTEILGDTPEAAPSPPAFAFNPPPPPANEGTPNVRFPLLATTSRTITSPPPVTPVRVPPPSRPSPNLPSPSRNNDTIVCDANGACMGSRPQPSRGVVRGR